MIAKQRAPLRSGLVSITFRKLSPAEVIALAGAAKLDAIEWGGDVHVPHGDLATAAAVRRQTADAGLSVAAYGSYFRADCNAPEIEAVLDTAVALGALTVRVWAGRTGSAATDAVAVGQVVERLTRACDLASPRGLTITLEYHGGTLTDTLESTLDLIAEIDRPALRSGWQPRDGISAEAGVAELDRLRPVLGNVHVFQWWPDHRTRRPLAEGAGRWMPFLRAASDDRERFALLEFVVEDRPEQLAADAACLNRLLAEIDASRSSST